MQGFRHPNITAKSVEGQLGQLKTYLYQLTNQLNYAVKASEGEQAAKGSAALTSANNASSGAGQSDDEKAQSSFNEVKSLIIKSADIVNAYYDVISKRLVGEYSALSIDGEEYQQFKEDTTQWRDENPTNNTDYFEAVQKISKYIGCEVDEKGQPIITDGDRLSLSEIRTDKFYIKTGWVDTSGDGGYIGGMELGQVSDDGAETDVAFARMTTKELIFYSNDKVPIAKFTNNSLETGEAKINRILFKEHIIDGTNGVAFIWAGDE